MDQEDRAIMRRTFERMEEKIWPILEKGMWAIFNDMEKDVTQKLGYRGRDPEDRLERWGLFLNFIEEHYIVPSILG